jgi:divalent metal cation (Fe/Co/Zn/Cd) transporter
MSVGAPFTFPPDKREARESLRKLCWLSIVLLIVAATVVFLTTGQSQAMKTAWVSDVLTAIPPIALLVALRFELRPPSRRFPEGYARSISVAFLVTASMLSLIGLYLLLDSLMKLVHREHPAIGLVVLFGHQLWLGWLMMVALAFSASIGFLLGKLKSPVAERLHSKALQAEAEMNRAEWMSEGAAIVGLLLVAFGFWWGDAAAAAFISVEIVRDGWHNLRQVIGDMMDESPTKLAQRELEPLPGVLRDAARRLPWVEEAAARLREHGHTITGEVFVVPRRDSGVSAATLAEASEQAARELSRLDWRIHGLIVVPVAALEETEPPRVNRLDDRASAGGSDTNLAAARPT